MSLNNSELSLMDQAQTIERSCKDFMIGKCNKSNKPKCAKGLHRLDKQLTTGKVHAHQYTPLKFLCELIVTPSVLNIACTGNSNLFTDARSKQFKIRSLLAEDDR
jgi:hypothetical protein